MQPAFTVRKATFDDVAEIERVMRESLTGIGSRFYDRQQVSSSIANVAHIDHHLIADGTYFVAEAEGEMVGCGGWSRRGKLYAGSADQGGEERPLDPSTEPARIRAMFVVAGWARRGIGREILRRCEEEARAAGFRRLELMAMLSGADMYRASGYEPLENVQPPLADGTPLPLIRMQKSLY